MTTPNDPRRTTPGTNALSSPVAPRNGSRGAASRRMGLRRRVIWNLVTVRIAILALASLAVLAITGAPAPPRTTRATKEFMREKLNLAQQVLEGVTLEDYAMIEARARRLSAMSQQAPWQVLENPEYAQHSLTYRRQADALVRAGKEKNLDAATLAYVRLTMSCVDCHKFVRGKLVAQRTLDPAPNELLARATGAAALEKAP